MVNTPEKKVVAIIQTRLTSTRLPKKVLMEIEGKPMILHVLDRLKQVKNLHEIVLAIPDTPTDDPLEEFAKAHNIAYFRGSESNVLERHYLAAKKFDADVIVRMPSDNPCVDPKVMDVVIQKHLDSDADYTSNIITPNFMVELSFPVGIFAEVFNMSTLEKVYQAQTDDYEKEHATPYIYRHPELFKLQSVVAQAPLNRPEIRLTVDTQKDMDLIKEIYKNVYVPGKTFYLEDVIGFLDKHPNLITSNT